jgi:hypothetical protein
VTESLANVYSNITGPEDVGAKLGKRYMLNFIDDTSRISWIYSIKEKSDTMSHFKDWKALIEK